MAEKSVLIEDAVEEIRGILDSEELRYSYDEEDKTFKLGFNRSDSPLGTMRLAIYARPAPDDPEKCIRLTATCTAGFNAPVKRRAEVAEYLHRANYGMIYGKFELDYDDGEVIFRMSLNTVDGLPCHDALDDLYKVPTAMVNRYADGMLEVSMGLLTPEKAIEKIENNEDED